MAGTRRGEWQGANVGSAVTVDLGTRVSCYTMKGGVVAETQRVLTGVTVESGEGRDSSRLKGVTGCHWLHACQGGAGSASQMQG